MACKHPVSVLVVIYASDTGRVLMLQRRDDMAFWQSVTGSCEPGESLARTAQREVQEETGIDVNAGQLTIVDCQRYIDFEIFSHFRHRYAPGTTHNREHWFTLALPGERDITLSEHLTFQWLDPPDAAALTKSWSNRQAIEEFIS
ncbi:dihydroneopterin triphosphate diphosphatase [Erwinia amylovora]|uniref:dATP pyrophosphohydrolase n=3 Tax=Erwinia amylovora TaxID=552 RepID=A0A830ZWH5_ERWAM|nr:dihydroneopterin triphosphate diphosphatase [Erwinia amylovora]EKV54773.1 dATP pyrophosphohydrolase [Erwinia amylovora ACW56400]MCK8155827.1 dihydroneopterin triphosphate diphosphatase [Erwinia amylovora]MCK8158450.1 dihydroneopterin triphosphate diphosphatase [Erwinia amylovora]MCK8161834.1 dihydroneopterin triphosphate diphosphatase [Erwinia amylovora]MCK8165246.1 dihydroneopterin triphosphate diphosphatase [Erwinia amylovora]